MHWATFGRPNRSAQSLLAATNSRGVSTNPKRGNIMSKDSKRTKKGTASHDSKSTDEDTVSKDSRPTKKGAVSNESEPTEKGTVSHDNKSTEKGAVSNDIKPTEKAVAGEAPVFDFTKLMSQFRLPGVDFAALVERERKNIEALAKANRIAF